MWRLLYASILGAAVWSTAYVLPSSNPEQQLDAVVAIATEDSEKVAGYAAAYMPEPPAAVATGGLASGDGLTIGALSQSQPPALPAAPAKVAVTGPQLAQIEPELVAPVPVPAVAVLATEPTSRKSVSPLTVEGPTQTEDMDVADARKLTVALQTQLRRVGCYRGSLDGEWDARTQRAMARFTDRIGADLPLDRPDYILLTLVEKFDNRACGAMCSAGQTLGADGRCRSREIVASHSLGDSKAVASARKKKARVVVLAKAKAKRQARLAASKRRSQLAVRIIRKPRYGFTSGRVKTQRIGYGFIGKRLLATGGSKKRSSSVISSSRARGEGMWN